MGIVIPLGPVLGPIIGGLILQNLDWRWMFLVNLPIGVLAFLLSLRVVPADPPRENRAANRLDTIGLALLAPGFAVLIFALSRLADSHSFGNTSMTVALVMGAVLLAIYVAHALRTRTAPLIDLRLFTSRSFSASVTVMALTGIMLFSSLFVIPLYYQQARGHSVLTAGLLLAPLGIGSFVAMPVAGRLSDRLGARTLVPLGGLAIALSALVFTQAGANTDETILALCGLLIGLGLGFVGAPTMGTLYRTLPAESIPQGTSALYIINQLGASLGIAAVALILQSSVDSGRSHAEDFHGAFWWVFGAALAVSGAGWLLPGRPTGITRTASGRLRRSPVRGGNLL